MDVNFKQEAIKRKGYYCVKYPDSFICFYCLQYNVVLQHDLILGYEARVNVFGASSYNVVVGHFIGGFMQTSLFSFLLICIRLCV